MKQWGKYKEEIENCSNSFTAGRRNDDLVNWTLAFIAVNNIEYGDNVPLSDELCIDEFEQFMLGLRDKQIDDLNEYDWKGKIKTVVAYYGEDDLETLESLLIDVEYN